MSIFVSQLSASVAATGSTPGWHDLQWRAQFLVVVCFLQIPHVRPDQVRAGVGLALLDSIVQVVAGYLILLRPELKKFNQIPIGDK